MALIIRTALTREDELLAALLQLVNGELDDQNIRRGSLAGTVFRDDSIGSDQLAELVDLTKPVVTTLPAAPTDGEVVYYQNSAMEAQGVVWTLKYRPASGSAYDWEFVGGSPLIANVGSYSVARTTSSLTYVALADAGPSIVLPLAGDYDVRTEFQGANNGIAWCHMSYDIGGTGAVDADAVSCFGGGAAGVYFDVGRTSRKAGLGAVTLTAKYRVEGGTGDWRERRMLVWPVRVA